MKKTNKYIKHIKRFSVMIVTLLLSFTIMTQDVHAIERIDEIDNNVGQFQDLYLNFDTQGVVSLNDLRVDNNVSVDESLNFGYDGASAFILYSNDTMIDFWYTVENFVVTQPHVFYYGGFSGTPQIYNEHVFESGVLYAFDWNVGYITAFDSDLVELFSYSFDDTDVFISFSSFAYDFVDYQQAYDEGFGIGFDEGYQAGVDDGPDAQYRRGYDRGRELGITEGFILGSDEGLRRGQNQNREFYGIYHNSQWLTAEQWGNIEYTRGTQSTEGEAYDIGYRDGSNDSFMASIKDWIVPAIIVVLFLGGALTIIAKKREG